MSGAPRLLLAFMISVIGFAMFRYGRKLGRFPQIVGGLLLMLFPYLVSNGWLMLAIAGGIGGLVYGASKAGL